jgi:lambda family phage portal protein
MTPVTPSLLDKIITWAAPDVALRRQLARHQLALTGAYQAADRSRRANQNDWRRETDADGAILWDLPTLREASQNLVRNSPIAGGALRTNVTKVVGTGLKVKPTLDRFVLNIDEATATDWEKAAAREYRLATETREIDAERHYPFSLLQGLIFLKTLEDGDVFVNMPRFRRPGSPYSLRLQVIEGARCLSKDYAPPTASLTAGVQKDASGAPVAYHITDRHPGVLRYTSNSNKPLNWTIVPAFGKSGAPLCLHLFDKTRPGQTRGVPYLAPVIELVKQLGKYTDAEVMAAVISGMLAITVKNEMGDPEFSLAPTLANPTGDKALQYDSTGMELRAGSVIGLAPGEEIGSPRPGRPNPEFDAFWTSLVRQIGVALELPFELLIKHFTASYSASRAALMEAWDYFRRRRHWLTTMLCQPVYEAVITEAVALGRLDAPGFFSDPLIKAAWLQTTWIGDAPYHLDPKKEADAAVVRMNNFLTTHGEETAAMPQGGSDWEAKIPEIIREQSILKENDLIAEPPEPVVASAPADTTETPDPNQPESDLETT